MLLDDAQRTIDTNPFLLIRFVRALQIPNEKYRYLNPKRKSSKNVETYKGKFESAYEQLSYILRFRAVYIDP